MGCMCLSQALLGSLRYAITIKHLILFLPIVVKSRYILSSARRLYFPAHFDAIDRQQRPARQPPARVGLVMRMFSSSFPLIVVSLWMIHGMRGPRPSTANRTAGSGHSVALCTSGARRQQCCTGTSRRAQETLYVHHCVGGACARHELINSYHY